MSLFTLRGKVSLFIFVSFFVGICFKVQAFDDKSCVNQVTVIVIDDGFALGHPYFKGKIKPLDSDENVNAVGVAR